MLGAVTSQCRLEPTLLTAADGETRFGHELVDLTEEADSVVAPLIDHRRGTRTQVHGANSTVRDADRHPR